MVYNNNTCRVTSGKLHNHLKIFSMMAVLGLQGLSQSSSNSIPQTYSLTGIFFVCFFCFTFGAVFSISCLLHNQSVPFIKMVSNSGRRYAGATSYILKQTKWEQNPVSEFDTNHKVHTIRVRIGISSIFPSAKSKEA